MVSKVLFINVLHAKQVGIIHVQRGTIKMMKAFILFSLFILFALILGRPPDKSV